MLVYDGIASRRHSAHEAGYPREGAGTTPRVVIIWASQRDTAASHASILSSSEDSIFGLKTLDFLEGVVSVGDPKPPQSPLGYPDRHYEN